MIFILLAGCNEHKLGPTPPKSECILDSDCTPAGCSGQLCLPKDKASELLTTCEFRAEYECLRLTSCSCIEGSCTWAKNEEYNSCIEEKRNQPPQ